MAWSPQRSGLEKLHESEGSIKFVLETFGEKLSSTERGNYETTLDEVVAERETFEGYLTPPSPKLQVPKPSAVTPVSEKDRPHKLSPIDWWMLHFNQVLEVNSNVFSTTLRADLEAQVDLDGDPVYLLHHLERYFSDVNKFLLAEFDPNGDGIITSMDYCELCHEITVLERFSQLWTVHFNDLLASRIVRVSHAQLSPILVDQHEVARGFYGAVYCGMWEHRCVAVKRLHVHNMTPKQMEAFQHEVDVLLYLRGHPRIVELLAATDPYDVSSRPCLVFEYAVGGSLFDALHSRKDPSLDEKRLAQDIAEGVLFLHSSKPIIWHRDLKSSNVLLFGSPHRAKLCDFGTSRIMLTEELAHSDVGTMNYTAPEVFSSGSYSGASADVYSFGCILYELVTRSLPWQNTPRERIMFQVVVEGKRPIIPSGLMTVANDWKQLIQDCWAQEANKRPKMRDVLERVGSLPALRQQPM